MQLDVFSTALKKKSFILPKDALLDCQGLGQWRWTFGLVVSKFQKMPNLILLVCHTYPAPGLKRNNSLHADLFLKMQPNHMWYYVLHKEHTQNIHSCLKWYNKHSAPVSLRKKKVIWDSSGLHKVFALETLEFVWPCSLPKEQEKMFLCDFWKLQRPCKSRVRFGSQLCHQKWHHMLPVSCMS